jgi:methionyl-tRNA formyltransferase
MVNDPPGIAASVPGGRTSAPGPPLRIVYFGTPAFAVPSLERLLASRHRVVGVVSQPDRPRGRGQHLHPTPTKVVALAHNVPVLQPARIKDEAFLQAIRDLNPDLGVVAAFGRILPDALLAIPRLGMINVHASLLPRYRGAAPVHRAVLAGDAETGVTIMRVVTELDAGPMLATRTIPIPHDATSGEIEASVAVAGADLLLTTIDDLSAGGAIETPQDDRLATHAAKITKEEGIIDWSDSARSLHNKVRGLQPWPLASTTLGGVRYVIRRSATTDQITGAKPGEIVAAHADDLVVAAGGGSAIRILELQPEGRRPMTAREFLAGHRLTPGDRFGT